MYTPKQWQRTTGSPTSVEAERQRGREAERKRGREEERKRGKIRDAIGERVVEGEMWMDTEEWRLETGRRH
jgi:hypothetical protein